MVATRDEAGPRLTLGLPAHPVMPLLLGAFILGYLLVKLGCEPAPLLLGFVLGPLLEDNLRRAMITPAATRRPSWTGRSRSPC